MTNSEALQDAIMPMPIVSNDPESLNSSPETDFNPVTSPDVQEALSIRHGSGTITIVPLKSNRFAILGQDGQIHAIVDEAPDSNSLRAISQALKTKLQKRPFSTAEARFYGEPNDRTRARDARRRSQEAPRKPEDPNAEVEVEAMDLGI